MDISKLAALMKKKKADLKQKAKTIKPNPGANRYVLLPGWRKGQEEQWFHEFGQHYIKNEADEIQAVYPCMEATYGKPCPICEGLNRAIKATTDDSAVELLKKAKAGQSFLLNVLALDSEDPNTPQILEVRKTVFGQLVETIEEWGAGVFDPDTPQILVINREGKGLSTRYTTQPSPKKHPMPSGVLSKLNDLDEYVRQENEEQERRAIGAINSVAGLLPSPDRPKAPVDDGGESVKRRAAEASRPAAAAAAIDEELDALLVGMDDDELGTGT
jgi:hypothetical protein